MEIILNNTNLIFQKANAERWVDVETTPVTGSYMAASGSIGSLEGCAYATIDVNPSEQYKISTQ